MIATYSAIYGGYDAPRQYPVPVRVFTDATHPRSEEPRLAAKWWKFRPDLACPDADVTIWIDGSLAICRSDFPDLCLAALGDADALFVRHPWRDCIYEEAQASLAGQKYDGLPILEQAEHYRAAGHPEHWGLANATMIVRRNTDAVRSLGEAWWAENVRWTVQDQISLPPLLRTSDLAYRWLEAPHPFERGWLAFTGHTGPDVWR